MKQTQGTNKTFLIFFFTIALCFAGESYNQHPNILSNAQFILKTSEIICERELQSGSIFSLIRKQESFGNLSYDTVRMSCWLLDHIGLSC